MRGPNIDREKLKQELLDVCQAIVAEEGVAAVSARRLAGRIGCAVGSLYNVYGSLDEIIMEINGRTLDEIDRQVAEVVAAGGGAATVMRGLGLRYLAYSRDHYHLWSTLLEYPRHQDIALPDWYQAKVDAIFARIRDALLPATGGDRARADRAGKVLWSGFHGISALAARGRLQSVRAEDARAMVDSLVAYYLAGLAAEESGPARGD